MILDAVKHGLILQKTGRADSDVTRHNAVRLSHEVKKGDVVDIRYRNGKGEVSGLCQSAEVSRKH